MAPLQRYHVAWPDQIHGPWAIELSFAELARRWELVGLRVQLRRPDLTVDDVESEGGPLTTTLLRSLPLSKWTTEWRRWRAQTNRELVDSGAVWVSDLAGDRLESNEAIDWLDRQSGADEARAEGKAGRRVYWTPARLREVAHIYGTAYNSGENPTDAVAKHFNKSPSMAAKLVSMARRRERGGTLPPTKPGKAGWNSLPRPGAFLGLPGKAGGIIADEEETQVFEIHRDAVAAAVATPPKRERKTQAGQVGGRR